MDSWIWSMVSMVFYIISLIFVPILIIGAFLRRRRRHGRELDESNWYLQLSLSPKDAMSQWFLILGGLALANMIYAINNNFGSPLSWRLVLLAAILIFGALAYWGKSVYAAAIGVIGFLVWWAAQTAFLATAGGYLCLGARGADRVDVVGNFAVCRRFLADGQKRLEALRRRVGVYWLDIGVIFCCLFFPPDPASSCLRK